MSAVYSAQKDPSCTPVSQSTDWSKFLQLPQFYPNMKPQMISIHRVEKILGLETLSENEKLKKLSDLVGSVKNVIHFVPPKVHICRIATDHRVYTVAILFSEKRTQKVVPIVYFGVSIWKNDGNEKMDRRALAFTAIRRLYKKQMYIYLPDHLKRKEEENNFSIRAVAMLVKNSFVRHQAASKKKN
jgi:hypothetical protein